MDLKKFIKNLTLRYPSGSSDIKIDDIESYLERIKATDLQLETIELLMQENYSKTSFPFVKDIKDIYERGYSIVGGNKHKVDSYASKEATNDIYYPDKFINHVCMTQNMNVKQIIARYLNTETKQINGHELSTYDAYFLFAFSDMMLNYRERLRRNDKGNEDKTFREIENLKTGQPILQEHIAQATAEELKDVLGTFNKYREAKK